MTGTKRLPFGLLHGPTTSIPYNPWLACAPDHADCNWLVAIREMQQYRESWMKSVVRIVIAGYPHLRPAPAILRTSSLGSSDSATGTSPCTHAYSKR